MQTNSARTLQTLSTMALLAALGACGSGSAPPAPALSTEARAQAATATAQTHAACVAIAPFYWEIGDARGALASGATGDGSIVRSSTFNIASATKRLFGAYVVEKRNGHVNAGDIAALTMSSGYTSFGILSCSLLLSGDPTVNDCFTVGDNETYTADHDGKFFYNGGHFQKWGVDNGMGAMTSAMLTDEFKSVLGTDAALSFSTPQLAGGAIGSAESYARFLTRVLNNELRIGALLGAHAVCTLPGVCATAVSSPAPAPYEYSLGHWVESDSLGDGSFSSAGAFGFYPWIDASKKYYGIVSRHVTDASSGGEGGVGWQSAQCGAQLRKAFMSGESQ